jgi:hypothetical protein
MSFSSTFGNPNTVVESPPTEIVQDAGTINYPPTWVTILCEGGLFVVGDADGSGGANPIDIDDAVYLIAYIFSEGPAPVPYGVASGDATCDCAVDIDDVVYLIAYIFSDGNPPCSAEEWFGNCGPIRASGSVGVLP